MSLHYIADFGLQPQEIVELKKKSSLIFLGHCFLCAGLSFIFFTDLWLFLFLFIAHFFIDGAKIGGLIDIDQDQILHIVSNFLGAYL